MNTATSTPILEARKLVKSFGALKAVVDFSLRLMPGECLGLLGPNGAGKTTTISMICGLITPDAGEVLLEGRKTVADTDPIKAKLGLVPQDLALYEELTAFENLNFFGSLYHLDAASLKGAIESSLQFVGLADRAKDKVKNFSGGMKRRLNIAAALLHDPQLLLLDEPTVGVDPQSRNAIFENIAALRARGKTVLYTTHYMEEVERLCDRVIIVDHGKIVADDTLDGLKRRQKKLCSVEIELESPDQAPWLPELRQLAGLRSADLTGHRLVVGMDELEQTSGVLQFLAARNQKAIHMESSRPNLESIFLELTGRNLRDK